MKPPVITKVTSAKLSGSSASYEITAIVNGRETTRWIINAGSRSKAIKEFRARVTAEEQKAGHEIESYR
jgi:hypothetical protein